MARAKKRGIARSTGRRNSTKPKSCVPQKSRNVLKFTSERERVVDEGFAATPDGQSPQEAPQGQNDSAYASPAGTPPLTASNTGVRDAQKQEPGFHGNTIRPSKVISLRFAPHKLRALLEILPPTTKVTLRLPTEKLRQFAEREGRGYLLRRRRSNLGQFVEVQTAEMAPVKDKNPHDVLDDHLKEVIQNLYDMGSITHGYLPESQGPLVKKSIDLTHSLASLSELTADDSNHPAAAKIRSIIMPPEVIDYVANGRNPDIYTREFVENVQRGNQVLNGKMQAFGSFAEIYARETKSAIPDLAADMDRLMEHSGGFEREGGKGDWKMKKAEGKGS